MWRVLATEVSHSPRKVRRIARPSRTAANASSFAIDPSWPLMDKCIELATATRQVAILGDSRGIPCRQPAPPAPPVCGSSPGVAFEPSFPATIRPMAIVRMSERPERMFFSERSLRIPLARFCAMRRFDVFNLPILPTGRQSQTLKVSRYNFHKLTSSVPKWGLGIQGLWNFQSGNRRRFFLARPYPQPQAGTSACLSLGGTGGVRAQLFPVSTSHTLRHKFIVATTLLPRNEWKQPAPGFHTVSTSAGDLVALVST